MFRLYLKQTPTYHIAMVEISSDYARGGGEVPRPEAEPALKPVRARRRAATARTIFALMLREMTTTYGRSPGGYAWVVLEPVIGILFLTILFTATGLRNPPMGTNFALFYSTGLIPFLAFLSLAGKLTSAINYSKALLAYPAVTYVDAVAARWLLNFLTQCTVAVLVYSAIFALFDTKTVFIAERVLLAFAMLGALGLGIGTLNCFLASMFPIYQSLWSILTRPLLFVSCVFFIFDTVPQPYQDWLWWNPLIHIVGATRSAFYVGYDAAYMSPTYVFCVAGITLLIGTVFLHRYARDILYR